MCIRDRSIAAVKSKDTVKICDENGFVVSTPLRENVYSVPVSYTHLDVYKRQDIMMAKYNSEAAAPYTGVSPNATRGYVASRIVL